MSPFRESEPSASPTTDELAALTLAQLRTALDSAQITASDLAANLRRRASEVDSGGPALRSLLALDPDLEASAERADRHPAGTAGPLRGVPIAVKDTLDTAGLATTAGSLSLRECSPPARNAACVARLRAAGALVAAKTNLSEWSNFRGLHSMSGWSGAGGQTLNPYDPRRSPGGSSAGSAVAVAAGLVVAAIGSETDGSILCPAALNGIVGFKPTPGLVARTGAIPVGLSQDSLGVLARDVRTAATVLEAVAGPDPGDPASLLAPPGSGDLVAALDPAALVGARIGVLRATYFGYSRHADAQAEQALEALRGAGAVLIDPADGDPRDASRSQPVFIPAADEVTMLIHEARHGLQAYLATRPDGPRSVADLVEFNRRHADQELALFGQEHFETMLTLEPDPDLTHPEYLRAKAATGPPVRAALAGLFERHRLDALVMPTCGPAWLTDEVNGDVVAGSGWSPAAVAGLPSVSVPAGMAGGLPVGVALTGRPWQEARLLSLAFALESVLGPVPAPSLRAG